MNKYVKYGIGALIIGYFLTRSKKSKGPSGPGSDITPGDDMGSNLDQVKNALKVIGDTYGVDKAQMAERLMRWETAHFTSGQWLRGNTSGMEIATGKFTYPFGWGTLDEWASDAGIDPDEFSTYSMIENNTGKTKTFIKFPSAYLFALFLVYVIKKRGWNWGAWYSTNAEKQQNYLNKIMGITPRFTNELF
jgi:hypothetical protein